MEHDGMLNNGKPSNLNMQGEGHDVFSPTFVRQHLQHEDVIQYYQAYCVSYLMVPH